VKRNYSFTSESVTEGHPDKLCDQISDAILDAILEKDPMGRVACETLVTRGLVFVAGEITTECYVDIPAIVRTVVKETGYTNPVYGFDDESVAVVTSIQEQSPDIAIGVDVGGAGDQGIMVGYATNETPEMMPMPIVMAHRLTRRLAEVRKNRQLSYLRPDGKAQVTVKYENGRPVKITAIVLAAQHDPNINLDRIREDLKEYVINHSIPEGLIDKYTRIIINGTGKFVIGGPQADTGVTGRKIMVDTYGGYVRHGGGCFSGKDPTKVDRSAAYFARYVAKNIVASGLADKAELQLAYVIGQKDPVSLSLDTYGTAKVPEEKILSAIKKIFDFSPAGMIDKLSLRRPIYRRTAVYGHFGRNEEGFTWELTDMVKTLKEEVGA